MTVSKSNTGDVIIRLMMGLQRLIGIRILRNILKTTTRCMPRVREAGTTRYHPR